MIHTNFLTSVIFVVSSALTFISVAYLYPRRRLHFHTKINLLYFQAHTVGQLNIPNMMTNFTDLFSGPTVQIIPYQRPTVWTFNELKWNRPVLRTNCLACE